MRHRKSPLLLKLGGFLLEKHINDILLRPQSPVKIQPKSCCPNCTTILTRFSFQNNQPIFLVGG